MIHKKTIPFATGCNVEIEWIFWGVRYPQISYLPFKNVFGFLKCWFILFELKKPVYYVILEKSSRPRFFNRYYARDATVFAMK